jgi:hypothetical protein
LASGGSEAGCFGFVRRESADSRFVILLFPSPSFFQIRDTNEAGKQSSMRQKNIKKSFVKSTFQKKVFYKVFFFLGMKSLSIAMKSDQNTGMWK